jgi:hypothetical protein
MFERPLGAERVPGTRREERINPLGNRMVGPPEMAEEWARKPLRARLLPGKEHAIQIYQIAWAVTEI